MGDLHALWLAELEAGLVLFPRLTDDERADRAVILALISSHGGVALRNAHASLRNDRSVVLAAVRSCGEALRFASRRLQGDPGVVLAAVAQGGGKALAHAAKALRGDRAVMLCAVKKDGLALRFAATGTAAAAASYAVGPLSPGDNIASSFGDDAAAGATSNAGMFIAGPSLGETPVSLDGDVDLVLEAVAQTSEALGYASEPLRHGGLKDIVRVRLRHRAGGLAVFATIRNGDGGGGAEGGGGRGGCVSKRAGGEIIVGGGDDAAPGNEAVAPVATVSPSKARAKLAAAVDLDNRINSKETGGQPTAGAPSLPLDEPSAAIAAAGIMSCVHNTGAVPANVRVREVALAAPLVRSDAAPFRLLREGPSLCRLPTMSRGGEEFLNEFEASVGEYLGWPVLVAAASNLGLL